MTPDAAPSSTPDPQVGSPDMAAIVGLDAAWLRDAAMAVLRRPVLWPVAVRQILRLASPGWWRRSPRLPLPDPSYLHFRLVTLNGGDGTAPSVEELCDYLQWCRAWPRVSR